MIPRIRALGLRHSLKSALSSCRCSGLVCAPQDLALLSCDSLCLAERQCDSFFSCSRFLCSPPSRRLPSHKTISPTGLFPSSSFTAASGSIFITRSITKQIANHRRVARQKRQDLRTALNTAPDVKPALTSAEQHIWDDAVAYYVANYAAKDLLFSTELIQLKDQLGDFEDCDELSGRKRKFCDAGLPAKLTQVLEAAAPVYRAHLWPEHDRANRRWIMRVAPLVREQAWASRNGLRTFTRRAGSAKKSASTSRATPTGPVPTPPPIPCGSRSPAWIHAIRAPPRSKSFSTKVHTVSPSPCRPPSSASAASAIRLFLATFGTLWFSTPPVKLFRPVLGTSGATAGDQEDSVPGGGYTPYAVREGLYQRGWSDYFKLLQKFWQPYLDGNASFDDAIARMVSSLSGRNPTFFFSVALLPIVRRTPIC